MASQVLSSPLGQFSKLENRPVANFHPTIWGDQFISYTHEDEVTRACKEKQVEDLKEEIRRQLMNAAGNTFQQLKFINAVQRLGVAYHFEREIEEVLQHIYDSYPDGDDMEGMFNEFKDEKGDFKKALVSDVRGMLGLYEAAHLRVNGEDILDEALAFTTTHLRSMVEHLEYPLAEQVAHALKQPIRKDFNLVQSLHKEELSNIARWWKELDFATKLPFARDRLVEGYFWILGAILTKTISMTSIIDDIYDAYGTFEELELFTKAIERSPSEYMKHCYVALLDVYKEIEEEMEKKETNIGCNLIECLMMKNLVRAYFHEAKWFHEGRYQQWKKEYMLVALVTSSSCMLTTWSFIGMGEIMTKEAFDRVFSDPKILTAAAVILRLMDGITTHERGHVASGIECYMKQYGVSEEQVYSEFHKQVENAWLDINQECLKPTAVPMPLLTRVVNLSRVMDVIYKEEDGYTHVGKVMKNNIGSVLIDPIV
ncbi:hypothetical protein AAG906_039430 [Vitis piasezkii]